MIRYIIKRLLLMIPTLLVTSLLIFWAMDLAGGDPVQQILPENATVEQQEALRESMGLNRSLFDPLFPICRRNYHRRHGHLLEERSGCF